MLNKILLYMFLSLFFFGCSQVPKPVPHQFVTTQKKIQASEHWNIFAKDIANNIAIEIKQENVSNTSISFIPNDNSPFCRAFRSFLGTHFIKSGVALKEVDMADYQLDWSVQTVTHEGTRVLPPSPPGTNTLIALLGYGVYKIIDKNSFAVGVITTGVALDIVKAFYQINSVALPKNEIIINVSLKKLDKYTYRSTNVYYVNDLDTNHYYNAKDQLGIDKKFNEKTFKVSD